MKVFNFKRAKTIFCYNWCHHHSKNSSVISVLWVGNFYITWRCFNWCKNFLCTYHEFLSYSDNICLCCYCWDTPKAWIQLVSSDKQDLYVIDSVDYICNVMLFWHLIIQKISGNSIYWVVYDYLIIPALQRLTPESSLVYVSLPAKFNSLRSLFIHQRKLRRF